MNKTTLDDVTGYRIRTFELANFVDGVGVSATRYDKTQPPLTFDALNYLCKQFTGRGFSDFHYVTYETKEYLEWAKSWRGRLKILFITGEW